MRRLSFIACLLIATVSVAQSAVVVANGYYKLKNVSSSQFLAENYATAGLRMCASATNTTYDCIWKITNNSDGSVLITNVYTQRWICGKMTVAQTLPCSNTVKGEYAYKPEMVSTGIYRFVFYRWDSSCALYLIQGCHSYNSGADSQWKLEEVSITDAQANAAASAKKVDDMNKAYTSWNTKLEKYFTDLSCSELREEYQTMSDEDLRKNMSDLTSDLQDIAIKVKNGWADDGVEGRTKQFRVQEYKVYSDAYTWASKLGSWSMGDMTFTLNEGAFSHTGITYKAIPYFYLAEFAFTKVNADISYTPMDGYTDVSKNAIIAVAREVATAKDLLDTGTEAQKNAETPILKNCVDLLKAATTTQTPDEEVSELTDDEMYKYQVALEEAITDAESANAAMANGVLDAQIAAAQRVRDDASSTYLNLIEEKELLVSETKSCLKSATNTLIESSKTMLSDAMESYSYELVNDTVITYSFVKKEAYHQLDAQAIARLLSAMCEAETMVSDAVLNDTTTQAVITSYTHLSSAFIGLNTSKENIDKVPTLVNERWFKYYNEGGTEKPGYLPYDAYLAMREVYDNEDVSADDIIEAWDEYLATPRALLVAGMFYRFKCVAPVSNTSNYQYLQSSLVNHTANKVTNKRLAMSTNGTDDNSIFLWTGQHLCGFANNTTVARNSANMLTNNSDGSSSSTAISFESVPQTEKLLLKFTGANDVERYAYGATSGKVDGGGSAPAEYEGYRWYVEPVEEMGDICEYAQDLIDGSEKIGWPGYRSKAAMKELESKMEAAADRSAQNLLLIFDRMNKFKNSFQYPEDGMVLRLRGSVSGKYIIYGKTKNKNNADRYTMGSDAATSIFYYSNGSLLCYSNGIYMDCSVDGWNWKEAGATSGEKVTFYKSNKDHRFFVTMPSSRSGAPLGVMYDGGTITDQGAVADSAAMVQALTKYDGYYWYLDLVESLPVTVGSAGLATYSAPVDVQVPDGVTAYYAESYDKETSVLTMRSISDGIIPANTGVVLRGEGTDMPFAITEGGTSIEGNMFKAVVPSTDVKADDGYTVFILGNKSGNVSFYAMDLTQPTVMAGHKAYLQIPTSDLKSGNLSTTSSISFSWDGDATGLETLTDDSRQDSRTYNLKGEAVDNDYRGVVIMEGKKYLNIGK